MSKYNFAPERIAHTQIGNVTVSTVETFSGFSMARVDETMIFLDGGEMPAGLNDQDGERCAVGGGKEQHAKWVAKVRDAQYPVAQSATEQAEQLPPLSKQHHWMRPDPARPSVWFDPEAQMWVALRWVSNERPEGFADYDVNVVGTRAREWMRETLAQRAAHALAA